MMKPEELGTSEISTTKPESRAEAQSADAVSSRSVDSDGPAQRASVRKGGAATVRKGSTAKAMALAVKAKRASHRRQIRRSHANG
jgi:hypothetical protein